MKILIIADSTSTLVGSDGSSYINKLYKLFSANYKDVVVECDEVSREAISQIVPDDKIMTEPYHKGTAAAIGLATAYIANQNPQELIVCIFANQNIKYQDRLLNTIDVAKDMYKHLGKMLLIGVAITDQTSDYGYIKIGKVLQEISSLIAFEMISFKRTLSIEEKFIAHNSWQYLWDTGCLICRAENLLELYKDSLPDMFTGLMTIKAAIGTKFEREIVNTVYSSFPKISMSSGLLEKLEPKKLAVIPVDLGISKDVQL